MKKYIATVLLLLLPSVAFAQAYRFSSVQITSTTSSALSVTGGILCCSGRIQFDPVTGDITDPAGNVVGVRDSFHIIPTTQAVNTEGLLGLATQWNSGTNVFTALDVNIQGTAYSASSFLLNLRLNNTSVFSVNPLGNVAFSGTLTGNGGGLTNFSATQLSSGTVPAARLAGATYDISVSGTGSFNGTTVTGTTGTFSGALTSNSGTSNFAAVNMSSGLTVGGTASVTGNLFSSSIIYNTGQMYPGRVDTVSSQLSWYLGSHASYGLYSNTGLFLTSGMYAPIMYDTANVAFYVDPAGSSRLGNVTLGTASTSAMVGNWEFSNGGLGGGAPILSPNIDNVGSLGTNSLRWNLIRGTTITSGDLQFENGWTITESYKVGIAEPGLAILDENETLVMFIPKPAKTLAQPYVRTSKAQRARMDSTPNARTRTAPRPGGRTAEEKLQSSKVVAAEQSPAVEPLPDPRRARVGGGK